MTDLDPLTLKLMTESKSGLMKTLNKWTLTSMTRSSFVTTFQAILTYLSRRQVADGIRITSHWDDSLNLSVKITMNTVEQQSLLLGVVTKVYIDSEYQRVKKLASYLPPLVKVISLQKSKSNELTHDTAAGARTENKEEVVAE